MTQPSFPALLREVQKDQTDYEFYPTAQKTLDILGERLKALYKNENSDEYVDFDSFLDVGCGAGKVLKYVESLELFDKFYAIEKSNTLLGYLPSNYRLIGVDFWSTTFIDKTISVLYTNCPYSEFGPWIAKIIKEVSHSTRIFFLAPDRWANNKDIQEALRIRGGTPSILQTYCFEDSEDRKARANVELVELAPVGSKYDKDDPFQRFFDENFKYPEVDKEEKKRSLDEKIEENKLIGGANLIEILCTLHEKRLEELNENYKAVCSLPADLLKEFEIKKDDLVESLRLKLANCKKEFWSRLFAGMKNINRTLTGESQKEITGVMNAQSGIDFNRENCYAVVMWVIRSGNTLYDKQLVEVYKKMLNLANIDNYKSNSRVFKEHNFKYNWYHEAQDEVTHVKLKVGHRIVMDRCGGLSNSSYSWEQGLTESAANFIRDLLVIANNLGFEYIGNPPRKGEWNDSRQVEYLYKDKDDGVVTLFTVRAYLNGNCHYRFNPKFIHALNIQAGKLLKWLGSENEAETEIGVDIETATKFYNHAFRIGEQQLMLN